MAISTRDLKHRILTAITKLADRDTYSAAAADLESIANHLPAESIPVFLSCIQSTTPTDKSPVRKQCVKLLATLAQSQAETLSSHLPKILSNLTRRFRDPDASVRSACVHVAAILSSKITKPPFTTFLKPLSDAVFTEQELNSQICAATCLSAVISHAPRVGVSQARGELRKVVVKMDRLLKGEGSGGGYKGKAGVIGVIGSVVEAGGVYSGGESVRGLVTCLVGVLGSQEWGVRKAAAEVLGKVAVRERDLLGEVKGECMKVFEKRRYDKVCSLNACFDW